MPTLPDTSSAGASASSAGASSAACRGGPAASPVSSLRFGVCGCQSYEDGYYTAYRHLASGKVRDLYELEEGPYAGQLLMVASDRISAFDCIWQGEGGLKGVPGKGAALSDAGASHPLASK